MRKTDISKMSVEGLVERFVEIALQMDQAILLNQNAKYNRFFDRKREIVEELKRRDGDQRRRLLPLFSHPNIFVRLQAAVSTLAIAPMEARSQLQAIVDARLDTYSSEARSFIGGLDDGTFKPT